MRRMEITPRKKYLHVLLFRNTDETTKNIWNEFSINYIGNRKRPIELSKIKNFNALRNFQIIRYINKSEIVEEEEKITSLGIPHYLYTITTPKGALYGIRIEFYKYDSEKDEEVKDSVDIGIYSDTFLRDDVYEFPSVDEF